MAAENWIISEARTADGTFMVVSGEGHGFGLVADVTEEVDAHLIAAAPQLREAVLEAIATFDVAISAATFTKPRTGQIIVNVARAEALLAQLRAAFVKSEGR